MRTRNFTLNEIAHSGPLQYELLRNIGCVQMGYMQAIIDYVSFKLKCKVICIPTSGYRSSEKNNAMIASGQFSTIANDSNHTWRLENGYIRCAGDYRFYKTVNTPLTKGRLIQIPNSVIFPLLEVFGNEIYWNKKQDIIHIAQEINKPNQYWVE